MKFFYDFERKYARYAIRNLMYYITILYAAGLVIWLFDSGNLYPVSLPGHEPGFPRADLAAGYLYDLSAVLWFLAVYNGIFRHHALFMYHSLGQTLESVWGAFRFNVFFFMGVLAQILAALIGYLVFHQNWIMTTGFINSSIFLAFAMYFPDAQFLMFFILPVKAKWLAVAECGAYLYSFLGGKCGYQM